MEDLRKELKRISDEYFRLLRLDGYPVAVKLFKDEEAVKRLEKKFGHIRRFKGKNLALCQLICQAYYLGRVRIGTAETVGACDAGAAGIGLINLPLDLKEGKRYVGMYHINDEVGRRVLSELPMLDPGETKAVLVSPLERCPIEPDVVLLIGKPAQLFLVIPAYLHDKGGRLNFSGCGMFACLDIIVGAIRAEKPVIALPCNGFRIWGGLASEIDIACGIPGKLLQSLLEGLKFLYKGGIRFPPAWQFIDMETVSHMVFPLWEYTKEY